MDNRELTDEVPKSIQEAEEQTSAPKTTGVLAIRSANEWIEEAAKRPDPKTYFHGLVVQFENTCVYASSNVGKTLLAVQIAEDIAQTDRVLYLDLEQSEKQFQKRYSDPDTGSPHIFPPNFLRAELNPELIGGIHLEQAILESIEIAAEEGTKFIILDNMTFVCHDAEDAALASAFMMQLIRLKKNHGLTLIVIAHTPKRRGYQPITQDDLAGSAKLASFFDACIAMARCAKDNERRYLKQTKVRSGEIMYDADNVLVLELVRDKGYLHFEERGTAYESELLAHVNTSDHKEEIIEILKLQKNGKSLRAIADELGMTLGKVQRRLGKAKAKNITLPEDDSKKESTGQAVSPVSDNDEPIHPIRDIGRSPPTNVKSI